MALSCHWPTKVITVPKSDLTLESGTKYQITISTWFQLLRELNGSVAGMAQTILAPLYRNVSPTASTPRIVDVINGYTVQMEAGLYSVDFIDGNCNMRDVEIKNTVSVNTNNTTGFIDPAYLEYNTYNEKITVNTNGGGYPYGHNRLVGNTQYPINNFVDAIMLSDAMKLPVLKVYGNGTIATADVSGKTIIGDNIIRTKLTLESLADASDVEFANCYITGVLDGNTVIRECTVDGVTYFNGEMIGCGLMNLAPITLGGASTAVFRSCSAFSSIGAPVPIDFNHEPTPILMRDFHGGVKFMNLDQGQFCSVEFGGAGTLVVDLTTCTDAIVKVAGVGSVIDAATGDHLPSGTYGNLTLDNEAVCPHSVAGEVWATLLDAGFTAADIMRIKAAALAGKASGAGTGTMKFRDLGDTKDLMISTVDGTGNRSAVTLDV